VRAGGQTHLSQMGRFRISQVVFVPPSARYRIGMDIRKARADDLPSIVRIENSSFDRDAWDRELFLDYLAQSGRSVFLVAAIDRRVVGYALAFHSRTRAEIHSIAVSPAERGRGVAMALLRRIIALLRRRGFQTVSLNVRLENSGAIGLYRKLGFQRVRRVNGYYEDGAPAWRMRKS
jgi:ribosomal-protein-alanine N-acetyltransferase